MRQKRNKRATEIRSGLTLTEIAYLEIEERIVTLELTPGKILSESQLVESLGIGRTPIREALQRLANEGLVVIMPRRGIVVSDINIHSQLEMLRVRREIERLMSRLAALRAVPEERNEFKRIADGMKRASRQRDDVSFMRLDREFNKLVASASRNEYARKAITLTTGLSRRFWYVHYKEVLDLPLCANLHAELAEKIAAGNEDAAATACDRLIDYIETFTRASVDRPRAYLAKLSRDT